MKASIQQHLTRFQSVKSIYHCRPFVTPAWSQFVQIARMTTSAGGDPTFESVGIKNQTINAAAGISLSAHQKVLVGSVLDVS